MSNFELELLDLVAEKPWIYRYLSDEIKATRKIAEIVFKASGSCLEFAPDEFKEDKDLVLIAVGTGDAFAHASEELQQDKEIILKALEWDSSIVEYLDEDFYEDLEVMYKAIERDEANFEYLIEELQEDRDIALECLKRNGEVYAFLCDEFKEDAEMIESAIKSGCSLQTIIQEIENYDDIVSDMELVAIAIKNNKGSEIQYASNELRNDKELIEYAIEHELHVLAYIGEEARKDKDILRKYFKSPFSLETPKATHQSVICLSRDILSDYDFMLELIADNEYVFQEMYSDTFYNMFKIKMPINIDVAFCKKAYQVNPKTLKFMSNNMKKNVKE